MSEPQDKWLALLEQLAEGSKVAWDTQDIADDAEQKLLDQLQQIEKIQRFFAAEQSPPSQAVEDQPKALFEWGHLWVTAPLGAGSYGEVYRAYDPVLNREVALKLLKPDQLAAFHSKLFIEEAQRIARVRNRHVLAIHGAGVHDGRAGFWSDLIEGTTLQQRARVSLAELLAVAAALADALKAVHEACLVHGDVKAANVMQDQHGQYVLMDFGAGLEHGTRDSNNHSVGSPMLMAPELFVEQPKSPASDIYALGSLLFKLATDQYPVQGKHVLDVAQAHQDRAYAAVSALRADLPRSMQQLLQALIDPEPQKRPSAAACAVRLEIIKTEPARRKKRRLVLGIMGSLSLGLVLAIGGLLVANAQRQKAEVERQKVTAVNDFLQQILGGASYFGKGREVRVADLLDFAANHMQTHFSSQPHTMAALNDSLGRSYQNLSIHDASLRHFKASLDWQRSLYGDDHENTWQAMMRHAKVLYILGDHEPALATYELIVDKTKDSAEHHNMYQMARMEQANVMSKMGELEAAEALFEKVLATVPRADQGNSNYRFLALTTLSDNLVKQSRYEEALAVNQQAWEVLMADPDHKPTNELVVLNAQGIIWSHLRRNEEAEQNHRKQLELAARYYGKNNDGYLRSLVNLGAVLYHQNKWQEALQTQQEALVLAQQVKGKNHAISVIMGINLANTFVALGEVESGEQLMRDTLIKANTVLGPDDLETLKLEYNLAELLNNLKRHEEAEVLAQQTWLKAKEALGETHLISLLTKDNWAISLTGQGRHAAATQAHVGLLNTMQQVFGEQSPYTQLVWQHVVDGLVAAGDGAAARDWQAQMLEVLQVQHGSEHPAVQTAKQRLQELTP